MCVSRQKAQNGGKQNYKQEFSAMKKIIKLLQQKNDCLREFEKLSVQEYHRLCLGDLSHIESFYHHRQRILKMIDDIDRKLKTIKTASISEKDKKTMLDLIQEKKKITLTVLQQDLLIHSYLNDQRHDIAEDQIA